MYEDLSKEELLKECNKLYKQLNRKKVERLSWKKIMNGQLVKGPNYWSNGHFAVVNEACEIPKSVDALGLFASDSNTTLNELAPAGMHGYSIAPRALWAEETDGDNGKKLIIIKGFNTGFQALYINALDKLLPGFDLYIKDGKSPALLNVNGKMAGLIMPYRLKD